MSNLLKTLVGAVLLPLALCAFAASLLLERNVSIPPAPVPAAEDVRSGLLFARLAQSLVSQPEPMTAEIPGQWFEAVHRLVDHAKDNLAVDAAIDKRGATFRLSKRVLPHGWLNIAVRMDQRPDGGVPRISLHIGPWRVPDALTALGLRAGLRLLRDRNAPPFSMADLIPRFRIEGDAIVTTARIPKTLVGAVQAVLSPGPGTVVDIARVRSYYGELLGYAVRHSEQRYPQLVRHVAGRVRNQDDLKAAVVALTMYVDGPRVRRLAGERSPTPPCALQPQPAYLMGREDLPKHWTLSAALALFLNERTARAVGLWKELDDSLPGGDGLPAGSGFSFVDLGADMGGVALGMVAREGEGLDEALKALRSGRDAVILPGAILRLPEGVPLEDFRKTYGGLEQPRMRAEEARIRAILARSPLYRGLPAYRAPVTGQ